MPNNIVSTLKIGNQVYDIKDSYIRNLVNEVLEITAENNTIISNRLNNLNDRAFDNLIKVENDDWSNVNSIQSGIYRIEHSSNNAVTEYSILINKQNADTQLNVRNNDIYYRNKVNGVWGDWVVLTPNLSLSSNYTPSSLKNAQLHLSPNDSFEVAFSKLEKAILNNEKVTAASLNDLNSRIKTINDIGAEANVQSDWEESDSTSDAYIANKPFESVNEEQFIVDSTTNELSINKDILPVDYSKQYLTFVAKENGTFTFTPQNNNVISYSIDDGKTWTEGNEVTVSNGDKVLWKGSMTHNFGIGKFGSDTTAEFDVQGNVMSLFYGDDFDGKVDLTGKNTAFYQLFYQNTKVMSAENLSLPATTLVDSCYYEMFKGCTSLTKAPKLSATTLANECYRQMFQGCTSLTTAPVLPAITLTNLCYVSMFQGCSSLNYINAMFTTEPGSSYTGSWVNGVSSTGTFIKNSEATWDVTGVNGVPTGWNVYTDSQWKEVKHYELDALEDSLDDVHETIASALNDLDSRIEAIDEVGAQANVIEAIKVNDELLAITDKTVNIYDKIYIKISGSTVPENEEPDQGRAIISNFVDNNITPEYFQNLATKYDLNQSLAFHANNSNVIFEYNDHDFGVFNYVYDKGFSSYLITDENESVDDFKTLALFLSTKNNIVELINNSREFACCIIKWDNENSKWKFQWLENYKAITPGNYNGFSNIHTTTTISAYDYGGSNNHAKIVLTGKENPDTNAQINITTETDDGLRWNDRVVAVEEDCEKTKEYYSKQYLTFVAKESGTFTFTPQNNNIISYSIDNGSNWFEDNEVAVSNGDKVLWKGQMTPDNSDNDIHGIGTFSSTAKFDVQGNIMSLLFGDEFIGKTDLTGKNEAFFGLFFNNDKVINGKKLSLPATTLTNYCYYSMFSGCTSLTTAPELPATTLANYCYSSMFWGTSLTTPPKLPATTLAEGCYQNMFYYCKLLTIAPELPATTLVDYCYRYMFAGCTSLTTAPELPATTLVDYCYSNMFANCTSLITAPELPATTLVYGCYHEMFSGCSSLNYIKAMFTTTPDTSYTYNWVKDVSFIGTFVRNHLATWNVKGYYGIPIYWNNYLFNEINTINNKVQEVQEIVQKIDPLILANNEYYIQKSNSVILPLSHPDLSTQPSILPERFGKYYIYEVMVPIFGDNIINDLSNASDEEIYVYEKNNESYLAFKEGGLLMNDSTIINASLIGNGVYDNPTIINDEITKEIDYANEYLTFVAKESGTFTFTPADSNIISYSIDNGSTWTEGNSVEVNSGNKVLWKGLMTSNGTSGIGAFSSTAKFDVQGNIMSLLFGDDFIGQTDLTGNDGVFSNLFYQNTKIVSAKNLILPATTLTGNCYGGMFADCTALTTAPELPATTLTIGCYASMFSGCTALTAAPELPATTLVNYCYSYMFEGCTNLNYIKAMFTTTPSSTYTDNWVTSISPTGTFVKNSAVIWNETGNTGIPYDWAVETASYEDVPYEYSTTGIIDQFKINKIYTNLPLSTYAPKMNYLLVKYYNDQYLGYYENYYE